jgi:hypothetical protein
MGVNHRKMRTVLKADRSRSRRWLAEAGGEAVQAGMRSNCLSRGSAWIAFPAFC